MNDRDENGRFTEGNPGGPGRPKGIDIVALVKRKLAEVPEEEQLSRGEQLADIIIDRMLTDKSERMITDTLDRLHGKPTLTIDQRVTEMPKVVGFYPEDYDSGADTEDTETNQE